MYEGMLKLEANDQGVWISALKEEISQNDLLAFLRKNGVRKYDMKLLDEFLRTKSRSPFRIAPRDPLQEKDAQIVVRLPKDNMSATVVIEAPFFTKPWPTETDVREALTQKGVVFGIHDTAVTALIRDRISDEAQVVAEGAFPREGQNAKIELKVDPDKPPEVDEEIGRAHV